MIKHICHLDELSNVLQELGINCNDVCLTGSEILAAEGIRLNHDLDIILRPEILLQHRTEFPHAYRWRISLTSNIELYRNHLYYIGISDADIFRNQWYSDYQCFHIIPLPILYLLKKELKREKDKKDIQLMEAFFPDIAEKCAVFCQPAYKRYMMKAVVSLESIFRGKSKIE